MNNMKKIAEDGQNNLDFWDRSFGTGAASRTLKYGTSAFLLSFMIGSLARYMKHLTETNKNYIDLDVSKQVGSSTTAPVVSGEDIDELTGKKQQVKTAKLLKKGGGWEDLPVYAVPAALGIGGLALGAKVLDNMYDKETNEALKKRKSELEKLHKKVILARALGVRNALDDTAYQNLLKEVDSSISKQASEGVLENVYNTIKNIGSAASGLVKGVATANWPAYMGLLAATTFALGGISAYAVASKNDPENRKHEALRKGLKQYALGQRNIKPVEQDLAVDQNTLNALSSIGKKNNPMGVQETPISSVAITI